MKPVVLKVARIGNSRGVRIPAATLERFRIGEEIVMEERSDGILLRPRGASVSKLSWEDTAREMAAASEDWSEWDRTTADGLEHITWDARPAQRVADAGTQYNAGHSTKPSRRSRTPK